MAVFADDPDPCPDMPGRVQDRAASIVQLAHESGACRSRPGQTSGGRSPDEASKPGSARAGRISRISAAQRAIQCVQGARRWVPRRCGTGNGRCSRSSRSHRPVGVAGDAEDLVAVGPVIRLGGHADLDGRPLVEPPEQLGRPKPQPALAGLALRPSRRSARPGSAHSIVARTGSRPCRGTASRCRRSRAPAEARRSEWWPGPCR